LKAYQNKSFAVAEEPKVEGGIVTARVKVMDEKDGKELGTFTWTFARDGEKWRNSPKLTPVPPAYKQKRANSRDLHRAIVFGTTGFGVSSFRTRLSFVPARCVSAMPSRRGFAGGLLRTSSPARRGRILWRKAAPRSLGAAPPTDSGEATA